MEMNYFSLDQRHDMLRELREEVSGNVASEFEEKLDISWIYHDNALEGVVLSYHEIKAAIDKKIISDVSLIPMYEEIKNHKAAIEWVRDYAHQSAKRRKGGITVELLKQLYAMLTPEEASKGYPYRKENPLHRLYFHEIAPPDKIVIRLKKLVEWIEDQETQQLHALDRAARTHYRLMSIFPWNKNSGRVARLLMNMLLMRDGYPPVVIHSIDRQRYYDVLRMEGGNLLPLIFESLKNGIDTEIRFLEEVNEVRRSRRAS